MDTNTTDKVQKAGSFLSGILTGWGVPANWARVLTGAIIGAALAAASLLQSSCTLSFTQRAEADGSSSTSWSSSLTPLPQEENTNK